MHKKKKKKEKEPAFQECRYDKKFIGREQMADQV